MKAWVGPWLIGVSVLHTFVAFAFYGQVYAEMLGAGLVNTGSLSARNASASWFVLFGVLTFICGLAVTALERSADLPLPRSIGWGLLGLALAGSVLMPVSGFWLVLPPAAAIVLAKGRSACPATRA